MATYTAVVSLMHDLEQRLAVYDHIFAPSSELLFWPFTKQEMEILRNTVCPIEKWIRDEQHQCRHNFGSLWERALTNEEKEIFHGKDHELMHQLLEKRSREKQDLLERIFGRSSNQAFCPFTKKEMEILYNTVSWMDSLLRDSSGQSYHHELMNQILEKRILELARDAGNYLDFWAAQCLQVRESIRQTVIRKCLAEIANQIRPINCQLSFCEPGKYNFMGITEAVGELKQHLDDYISYSKYKNFSFAREDFKHLHDAVSFTDCYIRSTKNLMPFSDSPFRNSPILATRISEKTILEVAHKAGRFVDFLFRTLGRSELCLPDTLRFRWEGSEWERPISEYHNMNEITQDIVSINEELKKKIGRKRKVQDLEITSSTGKFSTFLSPSTRTLNTEGKLVGLEKDLETMLGNLTGHPLRLNVLSTIGMAGIGKTTFAGKLYDNPLVLHHFHIRAWVSVSQKYQVREMLLRILCCVTNVTDEICGRSDEELREQVYKNLKGKRYLIVLDDMWCTKAWDELKRTFPDDKNGSRIMLTSRLRDVAIHASQDTPPHHLRCLSKQESWELLSSKIIVDESYPQELVEIGKQIAYKCQGLPLALVVVGGLLSKKNKKLDLWEEVAQSVGSLVMGEVEGCQDILALSYEHLTDQLKACFIYMGIFPEDYEISVKKLIRLWIAEGFIRPTTLKSLEEVAEDYLKDLISRSLIFVRTSSSNGRIKTCYIHDLMRELCLRESRKQNFFHVIDNCGQLPLITEHTKSVFGLHVSIKVLRELHDLRRLSFHSSISKYYHNASFLYTHSILCFEKLSFSHARSYLRMNLRLLKVLDLMNMRLRQIPIDISNLILLKFLALTIEDSLLDIMCLCTFLSLQTLILDCEWVGHLPRIFWDMLELRHFHLKNSCLSYSLSELELVDAELPLRVLNNLRSVSTIRPISCTKKVFLSMPHLKKLGIYETEEDYRFCGWFENLVHLRELESLKYVFCNPFVRSVFKPERLPSCESFPPVLVKLTLSGTSLPWDDMLNLSMLPKLEVLKLRNYAFSGAVWKSMEGGFRCLKFLLIGSTDLEIWEADGTDHFPKLQHLVLRHCRSLQEIPHDFSKLTTLENIALHCCKDSAVVSATHIQEEQHDFGNDGFTIRITEG